MGAGRSLFVRKEESPNTTRAASRITSGHVLRRDDKCNREETSLSKVMGETVR